MLLELFKYACVLYSTPTTYNVEIKAASTRRRILGASLQDNVIELLPFANSSKSKTRATRADYSNVCGQRLR